MIMKSYFPLFILSMMFYQTYAMQQPQQTNENYSEEPYECRHTTRPSKAGRKRERYESLCLKGHVPYRFNSKPNPICIHNIERYADGSTKHISICPKGTPPFIRK